MTESSPLTHIQPLEGAILGSCGQPVPNTIAKVRAYTVYASFFLKSQIPMMFRGQSSKIQCLSKIFFWIK